MSRDYKQRNTTKNRKNSGSLILGLFIGYTLGLASAIGVWLYISQAPSPYLTEEKTAKSKLSEKSTPKPQREDAASVENQGNLTKQPRFDFYNILPDIDEPSSDDIFEQPSQPLAPTLPAKKTPELKDQYYLQTGSFRNPGDAERMKAELALLGVVATIQIGKSENNNTLHLVRIGPFTKMEELDKVRASLQGDGITTSLVRAQKDSQ